MRTKRLVTLALFATIALTIFTVESAIPAPVPIPGIKLGLANIVTLILLMYFKPGEVYCVLLVRIVLGCIFGGQMMTFFYSISGGTLCFLVMLFFRKVLDGKYLVLVSMGGAAAHNIGQIAAAYIIMNSAGVFAYLPVLLVSGFITGAFTGGVAAACQKYLDRILKIYTLD